MKILFFISVLMCFFFVQPSLASMNFLYNSDTGHSIQDNSDRTEIEILKTLNKEEEEGNYQMIRLTSEEEKQIGEGTLTVVVEGGLLIKKVVVNIITEAQKAKAELKAYVLSVFPDLINVKDLTTDKVKNSTLAPSIKAVLYNAIINRDLTP